MAVTNQGRGHDYSLDLRIMKLLTKLFLLVLVSSIGIFGYNRLPIIYKHEMEDWYARLGEPAFVEAPDSFTTRLQEDVIREYTKRGHKLTCYGNLQKEDRVSVENDYLCFAHINTAYDGIPARMVTFFFSKSELSDVRIEFPSSSYDKLQSYLSRKLANSQRLDLLPFFDFGTDNMGGKLMVWRVPEGILVTSDSRVKGDITVLLWTNQMPFQNESKVFAPGI